MKAPGDSRLPAVRATTAERRYAVRTPEEVAYARRPGLGALPEGGGAVLGFAGLQLVPIGVLLWAIWWPAPRTTSGELFAIGCTVLIAVLALTVLWFLVRQRMEFIRQLFLIPFIRLTVTDRRVMWTLPWRAEPLLEIDGMRVRGGLLGEPSPRGWAPAAILLFPGDPAGDEHGMIHFDRLPDAARFVDALARFA
ncbi:hypothetical protein [Sphingomonas quercus]|uniref:PH domain-containing protein n=1 Tax=Sphingomonas quercus TaxID=2842451 RepID=A0ABS6BJX3_9SPHN|nr:hypothetical protein [Sphingomonas quercus]MBU3078131.1 hypothetical protein [Sphingomonas quercus]